MENNLNKWFDAAKHNPPMISTKEVGAMINNSPAGGAKGTSGLSTLKKTIFMGTIFLTITSWLYWMNSSTEVDRINRPESTTQTAMSAGDTLNAVDEKADFTKRILVIPNAQAENNQRTEASVIGEKWSADFYPIPTKTSQYTFNNTEFIYLTEEELAGLGIQSDGRSVAFTSKWSEDDSLVMFIEQVLLNNRQELYQHHEYKTGTADQYKVWPKPIIVEGDFDWYWLLSGHIEYGYLGKFHERVKHLLVPIVIQTETTIKKKQEQHTYVFWYKPESDFLELLPPATREQVIAKYGNYTEQAYDDIVKATQEEAIANAALISYTKTELEHIAERSFTLTKQELKRLGFYQVNNKLHYTNYYKERNTIIRMVELTEENNKLAFTGSLSDQQKYKLWLNKEVHPLFVTDSAITYPQFYYFQTTTSKRYDDAINEKARFKKMQDTLVPIRVLLSDHKTVYYIWFEKTAAFLKMLEAGTVAKINERYTEDKEPMGNYPVPGVNSYHYGNTSASTDIRLTNEELAGLGIITDGNTLRYLTQSDTTVYHFDYNPKATVFAFSIQVTKPGDIKSNNIHELDEELKKLSNSAVPALISINQLTESSKESFMIAEQNVIPFGYRMEFINSIKNDLVPIVVETKGNSVLYQHDNEIVFWYKNNEIFWQNLPDWVRLKVQKEYPKFNEEKYRKLISDLKQKDKQANTEHIVTAQEIKASQAKIIDLTPKELRKLNIRFDGKQLYYQQLSQRIDSSYVVIDLVVTPDMFSLNTRAKTGKAIQYKENKNYAWYITDTLLGITQNFVDPLGTDEENEQLEKKKEQLFKERMPEMVPVRIRFDAKAVSKAKYKNPQTVLLFWFPATDEFIKALPESIQNKLGVNIANLNRPQIAPVKYIELTDEQLMKFGVKRNPESITVPMHTGNGKYMFSDYSSKGSVHHFTTTNQTTDTFKSNTAVVRMNFNLSGSGGAKFVKPQPTKVVYPNAVLITEGNGLHWLAYQLDDEMSKEDQDYMIQHGLSPVEYKPAVEARKRGEAKLVAELNTYIALKVKSNEVPSGGANTLRNPDLIIWFKADSLLLASLPNELSEQIKKELDQMNLKQSGAACQFFEACRSVKGTIQQCEVYPNPTSDLLQIKMQLGEPRLVSVYLTDISGKKVKDCFSDETLEKGLQTRQIQLGGLSEGMYLLHITTNKGEYIVQRVIKKG